ncbi:C-type lectin domain 4 member E [Mactra antiquata]
MFYVSLVCFGLVWTTVTGMECPDTWTHFHESCYLFGHQHLNFVEAAHYCAQHNSHLVYPDTAAENAFLKDHITYMTEPFWWIGLTDDGIEGVWVWYGTNESPTFTDWTHGQPDDHHGNEDCASYRKDYGWLWNDIPCDASKYPPICEME